MGTCSLTDEQPAQPKDVAAGADHRSLRILVLPREEKLPILYYEPSQRERKEEDAAEASGPASISNGLRARLRSILRGVRDAENHAPAWLRSPIVWLKSKLPADERLLMALRYAKAVTLVHPTSLPGEVVRGDWDAYLDNRFRFRIGWFAFYLVVLVPSVLLTMLPGPNVVGLWVTFRLVAHALAIYGISRAKRGRIEVSTRATEVLDGPIITDRAETVRVQKHFDLIGLRGRLKRERVLARLRTRRSRAARSTPIEEVRP